jgi:hypothetical protein
MKIDLGVKFMSRESVAITPDDFAPSFGYGKFKLTGG